MIDETDYEAGQSEASATYPVQCSALRKNGNVMVKARPCKIVSMTTSKTGKHGHAKIHLVALDIFTGKKYEDICPSTHNMEVPNIIRQDYTVCNNSDGYLELMLDNGSMREDLKLPEGNLGKDILKKLDNGETFLVTVLSCKAVDEEQVIAIKGGTKESDNA